VIDRKAQAIKNPSAKQSLAALQAGQVRQTSGFRIALTGHPVEKTGEWLWALMDFLNPTGWRRRISSPGVTACADRALTGDTAPWRTSRPGWALVLRRLKTDKIDHLRLPRAGTQANGWAQQRAEQALPPKLVDETLDAIARRPWARKHGPGAGLRSPRLKQRSGNHAAWPKEGRQFERKKGSAPRSAKLQRLKKSLLR